ncbi:unnamed protein product [Allacma fusca]|uniref:Uncharacterized protein n=1 Tax=Allacma fusca TaxID=39272 RepID=A0A8J2JSF9_9HEXA|nr:unnamed protein product [Allacma fusca]
MSEKLSQCNVCKEPLFVSGNYSITIVPSKRIPKKASKVHMDTSISAWGMTKFQKYLLKRSTPTNFCEISCGTCQTTCKIPMTNKKKLNAWRKQTSFQSVTPLNLTLDLTPPSTKSKRKKKKEKEVNAGLIIPESFQRTPSHSGSSTSIIPTSRSVGINKSSVAGSRLHSPTIHKTDTPAKNTKTSQSRLLATRNAVQKTLLSSSGVSTSSLDKFLS